MKPHKAHTMHMPKKVQTCRVCGCTDLRACEGGCSWVTDDLCSRCAAETDIVADISIENMVLEEVTDLLVRGEE